MGDLYITLEESKLCDTVGYVAIPECGLPGQKLGNRHARNADLLPALLLAGSCDPSSIWFQYFLCKDIDLYCYFFTQGWTQGQYGQYYLYDNLLDENTGLFAGSTDSSNLATIALLGGLGGGIGQPSGYYPSYGAPAAAPSQGRKRREAGRAPDCEDPTSADCMRKRRSNDCDDPSTTSLECSRKRRSNDCDDPSNTSLECSRKRRSNDDCDDPSNTSLECRRKRRSNDCDDPTNTSEHCMRKRRSPDDCEKDASCRKRRQACDACKNNPDSTECTECSQ